MIVAVSPGDLVCAVPGPLTATCAAGDMAIGTGSAVTGSVMSGVVEGLGQALFDSWWTVQAKVLTLWVHIPTPDAQDLAGPGHVRGYVAWLTAVVLLVSVLGAALRTMLARDGRSLADLGRTVVVTLVVSGVGVASAVALLRAGDAIAAALIDEQALVVSAGTATEVNAGLVATMGGAAPIVLAILGLLASITQFFVLLGRDAVLPLVVVLLPLAAAAGGTILGRAWFGRLAAWLLALAFYKPAAAVVYAVVLVQLRTADSGFRAMTALAGMVAAILVLPALLKLFAPLTAGGGGGGGGYAMATAAGTAARISAGAVR
jgi:hypothetical protein